MTTPITKELREHAEENVKALRLAVKQHAFKDIRDAIEMDLKVAEFALAAMDAEPVAWDYEWASCITCEGPLGFKRIIEREAPPEWAIDEGQARNIIPLYAAPQARAVPEEIALGSRLTNHRFKI